MVKYLGQCDRIRKDKKEGERFWQHVTKTFRDIEARDIENNCDVGAILDDGETFIDWLPNDSLIRLSEYKNMPVYWVCTSGFEFFWSDVKLS